MPVLDAYSPEGRASFAYSGAVFPCHWQPELVDLQSTYDTIDFLRLTAKLDAKNVPGE